MMTVPLLSSPSICSSCALCSEFLPFFAKPSSFIANDEVKSVKNTVAMSMPFLVSLESTANTSPQTATLPCVSEESSSMGVILLPESIGPPSRTVAFSASIGISVNSALADLKLKGSGAAPPFAAAAGLLWAGIGLFIGSVLSIFC